MSSASQLLFGSVQGRDVADVAPSDGFTTIFFDDFEENEATDPIRDTWGAAGANSANWIKNDAGWLESDTTGQLSNFGSFYPTGVTSSKTLRLRTKLSWADLGSSQSFPNQGIHGQGSYASSGTVLVGYVLLLNSPSHDPTQATTLLLQRRDSSGDVTSSDSFPFVTTPNTIYNLEMLVESNGICSGKIWEEGSPEPTSYQVSVTDAVTTGAINGVIRQSPDTLFKWYDYSIEEYFE